MQTLKPALRKLIPLGLRARVRVVFELVRRTLRFYVLRQEPVIIYQMGKVGS
jgi:hypothetical protein